MDTVYKILIDSQLLWEYLQLQTNQLFMEYQQEIFFFTALWLKFPRSFDENLGTNMKNTTAFVKASLSAGSCSKTVFLLNHRLSPFKALVVPFLFVLNSFAANPKSLRSKPEILPSFAAKFREAPRMDISEICWLLTICPEEITTSFCHLIFGSCSKAS